jgi:type II secretory pathway pseudopilin PulG
MRNGRKETGFTYVALLLSVAIIGIGLAATGQVWSGVGQRDKERELLFVGHEIRNAIKAYAQATPGPVPRYPAKLEDLLQDNRYPGVKRYLRRVYVDPMTGKPEWGIVQAPGGGIQGVYSLSTAKPMKTGNFDYDDRSFEAAPTYAEWRFSYEPAPAQPAAAPSPAPAQGGSAPSGGLK